MSSELIVILCLAAIIWFWIDSLRAREAAIKHCAQACSRLDLQFLDQTVALKRLGLQRNKHGRVQFKREYRFEFSNVGNDRLSGLAVMLGNQIQLMHLESYEQQSDQ